MLFSRYAFLAVVASLLAKTDAAPAKDADARSHKLEAHVDARGAHTPSKSSGCRTYLTHDQQLDVVNGKGEFNYDGSAVTQYQDLRLYDDRVRSVLKEDYDYQTMLFCDRDETENCCSSWGNDEDRGSECCYAGQVCVEDHYVEYTKNDGDHNQCFNIGNLPGKWYPYWNPPPLAPSTCATCNGKCYNNEPCTPACMNPQNNLCYAAPCPGGNMTQC
jgi:hypothetical protein